MILTKLLFLILLLLVGLAFAVILLLRLSRASQRLAELQKDMVANDMVLQAKMEELQRQRMAAEARAVVQEEQNGEKQG